MGTQLNVDYVAITDVGSGRIDFYPAEVAERYASHHDVVAHIACNPNEDHKSWVIDLVRHGYVPSPGTSGRFEVRTRGNGRARQIMVRRVQ